MTISAGDIVIAKTQVMADVPEGGGAPVAAVVMDGVSNSIFSDISEADRAGGSVQMRKIVPSVRTPTQDGFYDANVIVAEPPKDPRVSLTLFQGDNFFDRRAEAQSRLEAYLAAGTTYQGLLYGDCVAGQMVLALQQREEVPLPVEGQALFLSGPLGSQYVRTTKVTSLLRTFNDGGGDFKRVIVTLQLSDRLAFDFPGFDAIRSDASVSYTGKTRVRETIVADAARYYGTQALTAVAHVGDFTVMTASPYAQLVPSTRVETPITDARMNQQSATLVKAGAPYTRSITALFTTAQSLFLGAGVLPGSISITRGAVTLTDKGGLLLDSSSAQVGTFDYANGVATLSTSVFGTGPGTHTITVTPAAAPTLVSDSFDMPVTPVTQRLSWTTTIQPMPARGSVSVSFRALGKWYVLRDDGTGALRGSDSSHGAGTVNYGTGSLMVTLGALPDVNTSVVVSFTSAVVTLPVTDVPSAGPALPRAFGSVIELGRAIKPGTLTITWNDGAARTATDSAGGLAGDASGQVLYGEGRIYFRPTVLPAAGTTLTINASETVQRKETVVVFTDGGTSWTCTLPGPVKARTVELAVRVVSTSSRSMRLTDDGAGNLRIANVDGTFGAAGTINYSTGAVSIPKNLTFVAAFSPTFKTEADSSSRAGTSLYMGGLSTATYTQGVDNSSSETTTTEPWAWWSGKQTNALEARYSGADGTGYTGSVTLTQLFMPLGADPFTTLPGQSLKASAFMLGTEFFGVNKDDGSVSRNPSAATGIGTPAGAQAVVAGSPGLLLTSWPAGVSSAPTMLAGATQPDVSGINSLLTIDRVSFRTAVSPLVNTGLNVAGSWASGATFSVTPNTDGVISTGTANSGGTPGTLGVFGRVDYNTGLVRLAFGRRVQDADAGQADVIDVRDLGISGVNYIKSVRAQADTLRYNASGYSYLPLDADILGINTVRLPADGRVPIFRPGYYVVVGHSGEIEATVSNGQTINCARTRLSRVSVIGSDNLPINTGWSADLDAGTVLFSDVTGYHQPVKVVHRIEDMALVRDVTIDGQLSLTRQLTHEFPLGSYVSSALMLGDLQARVSVLFDQISLGTTWADSTSNPILTASYNDVLAPIEVTNSGAVTERWAVVFSNTTSYQVIGEHVGVIATGTTGADCAPVNPATGQPYFTLRALGWGSGWAVGNVLRFNTVACASPVWAVLTVLQGPETVVRDTYSILLRGDIDRP